MRRIYEEFEDLEGGSTFAVGVQRDTPRDPDDAKEEQKMRCGKNKEKSFLIVACVYWSGVFAFACSQKYESYEAT